MSRLEQLTKSLVESYAAQLSLQQQTELAQALEVLSHDQKYNRFKNFFPDEGKYRRSLYPKHIAFFSAGLDFMERAFIAGNRVGKTEAGAFETVCHATGNYPEWWTGHRIPYAPLIWIGGDTSQTVRDIIQKKLVGSDLTDMGSGMLPKDSIIVEKCKTKRNVPDALEIIKVRHVSGMESTIVLKTYEQGRLVWQGTEVDFIWMDEECPSDIYGEALIRIMTTKGRIITTFTPLQGLTDLVLSMLDSSQETQVEDPVHVTVVTWDDVPHLGEEEKRKILARTPPQLRDARSKGIPTVGEGLIYPVDLEMLTVPDFPLPKHFKRLSALDVGWRMTACLWGAWDMENDIIYLTSEHKQGEAEPVVHAAAIKARGAWIRQVIDPAARGRSQIDGETLMNQYRKHGLSLILANNAVEAGIFEVWERMTTGRLKIFKSCQGLVREISLYHRDEKGMIVKKNDHLVDDLRYLCLAEPQAWAYQPAPGPKKVHQMSDYMQACV